MSKPVRMQRKFLADFWFANYVNGPSPQSQHCALCGNRGWLDTTGRAITPAGVHVGKRLLCICPNGMALRDGGAEPPPTP